jgi:4-hydroxy-4-methyl-2-oxoglutarate aldolase
VSAAAALLRAGTATLGEAWPLARIVDAPLRPLATGMALAGPALTVRCRPGDNLAIHRAIAAAHPGDVLIVDYGGSTGSGPFGEVMALACQVRGISGLVIDGAVRDSAQIAALGFPVFSRGLDIRGTTKLDRGEIGRPVRLGGCEICAGDIVVADADAVVVLAGDDLSAALGAAEARMAREAQMMDRLRQGETTLAILGLTQEDRA